MGLLQSPSQTSGPLFGFALMFEGSSEAVPPDSPGAVRIEGVVYDGNGPLAWWARRGTGPRGAC